MTGLINDEPDDVRTQPETDGRSTPGHDGEFAVHARRTSAARMSAVRRERRRAPRPTPTR